MDLDERLCMSRVPKTKRRKDKPVSSSKLGQVASRRASRAVSMLRARRRKWWSGVPEEEEDEEDCLFEERTEQEPQPASAPSLAKRVLLWARSILPW